MSQVLCECGDPEEAHTATCWSPYSATACQYAHDSDNPCWCYKFKKATDEATKESSTNTEAITPGR